MSHPSRPRRPFAESVRRAQRGEPEGFTSLVTGFQDMAVGYAYALLKDFQLAEDAAQEAFIDVYRHIGALREPDAFPGWLRRIVFKHCDRSTRGARPVILPFPEASQERSEDPSPADLVEENEMKKKLAEALELLPDAQRSVLVLHYMGGHSIAELSRFLGVPGSTVKKRLHDSRKRLREIVLARLTQRLGALRPSQRPEFSRGVLEILEAAKRGEADRVKRLLLRNPALRHGRDFMGNTPLIIAAATGHLEVAALLLEAGAPIDIHEAAAIGDTARVRAFLDASPRLLDAFSAHGFTALALAAHFGRLETLRLLLAHKAEVNIVSRHPLEVTPLHGALFGRQQEASRLLVEHGADVTARRGGARWPRAGWTPLHYAAAHDLREIAPLLLARGADPNARDDSGMTPIDAANKEGHKEAARLLTTWEDQE